MSEHAERARRPCRSGAQALAGVPWSLGGRSDQGTQSEHAERARRPCRSGAQALAGVPWSLGGRSDQRSSQ